MIALSYGITYIWGTVGIILITKYLPQWWGVDARAAARSYEKEHGVASGDAPTLTGWTTAGLRAYRLENQAWVGKSVGELLKQNPEYSVVFRSGATPSCTAWTSSRSSGSRARCRASARCSAAWCGRARRPTC
jgi:putative transport protein